MCRPVALAFVLGLTAFAAGCSAPATPPTPPDPANDRLMPGQAVMVVSKLEDEMIPISSPGGGKFPTGSAERAVAFVRTGDRGEVISDESKETGPARPVTFRITRSGLSNSISTIVGSTCTVPREVLRAAVKE